MGRQLRIDPEGAIHHIYTRGTKRWALFLDDGDRRRFLGILSLICDRYSIEVLAFCLMDNHVHLVVQCPDGQVSAAMRDLKSIYVRWFNGRHRSSGPMFEDRFGSKLVTSFRQLRAVIRYVHRNPYGIDAGMELGRFLWSSHGMYLGLRAAPVWMDLKTALPLFGNYQSDIETPLSHDAVQNSGARRSIASEDVSGTSSLTTDSVTLAGILIGVSHCAGCSIADVHPSRRNGLIGVAVVLALDHGFSPTEISQPFGYRTAKAVHSTSCRTRAKLRDDVRLQQVLTATRQHLMVVAA